MTAFGYYPFFFVPYLYRTGPGVYYHANGDKYVGNFKNGMQDGKGTFTWANGAVYEGSWKNNKRDGKGVYKWSNGDVYDGDLTHIYKKIGHAVRSPLYYHLSFIIGVFQIYRFLF